MSEATHAQLFEHFDKKYFFAELKKLYKRRMLPLELASRFGHFSSPPMGPADFDAKPMVLLLGQHVCRADSSLMYSRRRRGCDVDSPRGRVAARRRGTFAARISPQTGRGDAAAATWIFRGDEQSGRSIETSAATRTFVQSPSESPRRASRRRRDPPQ